MNLEYALERRAHLQLIIKAYEKFLKGQVIKSPNRVRASEALITRDIMRTMAMSQISQTRAYKASGTVSHDARTVEVGPTKTPLRAVEPTPQDPPIPPLTTGTATSSQPEEEAPSPANDKVFKNLKDCIPCNLKWDLEDFDWSKLKELLLKDLMARLSLLNGIEAMFDGNEILDHICEFIHAFKNLCPKDLIILVGMLTAYLMQKLSEIEFNLAGALSDLLGALLRPYIAGLEDFLGMYGQFLVDQIDCILNEIEQSALEIKKVKNDIASVPSSVGNALSGLSTKSEARRQQKIAKANKEASDLETAAGLARAKQKANPSGANESAAIQAEEDASRARDHAKELAAGTDSAASESASIDTANQESDSITNSAELESEGIPAPGEDEASPPVTTDSVLDSIAQNAHDTRESLHQTVDTSGITAFLRGVSQGVVDWIELNLTKAQDALMDLIGAEWLMSEQNLNWSQQVRVIATLIDLCEVIINLGNLDELCNEENTTKVIDSMNARLPNGDQIVVTDQERPMVLNGPRLVSPSILGIGGPLSPSAQSPTNKTYNFALKNCIQKPKTVDQASLLESWIRELST